MKSIKSIPWFIILFPLFFVLHGFTENYFFVSVKSALILTGIYTVVLIVLTCLFYFITKNPEVSALTAGFVLFIQFFWGYIHDFIKELAGNNFFSKYSFLLLLVLLLTALLLLILKKRKSLFKPIRYLNLLFLILIAIDSTVLILKITGVNTGTKMAEPVMGDRCDSCTRPDIYIITLDGYAGYKQLK